MNATVSAKNVPLAGLGGSVESETKVMFHDKKEEGFSRMPSQGVTTFEPNCEATGTVYISIVYYDIEGTQHTIADNLPHGKSYQAIVTSYGGIVDAKRIGKDSWLDKQGKEHKAESCKDCRSYRSLCTECLAKKNLKLENT